MAQSPRLSVARARSCGSHCASPPPILVPPLPSPLQAWSRSSAPNAPPQSPRLKTRCTPPHRAPPGAPLLSFVLPTATALPALGPGTMSFASEHYLCGPSSYRKVFGDGSRLSSRLSVAGGAGSYRSQSLSRCNVASSAACSSASSLGLGLAYRRPPASDGLDLSQAAARTNEYKIIRTNEKEQLQGLNDRFAVFIEKVHQLETQNRALEAELAALRQRHAEPSRVGELFQRELRDLRAQLEEASSARAQALLERDGLAEEVQRLRARCEEESRGREGAERALKAQQRDVDGATLARLDLEKKVESLLDELAFVRQVHDEEVAELLATLQASSQAAAEVDVAVAKPDLSSALREIRAQYESLAAKNLQSAEEWYKSKFANLNEQAARSTEAIRASREEIHEYRRQLQARTIEIEGLRGANESLERQILELEERHSAEVASYQVRAGARRRGASCPPLRIPTL